jgi:hypothetical protein
MEHEGVDFLQFAFRWVNCLLIREVPFDAALRLWDTYLAEGPGFADFLVGGGAVCKGRGPAGFEHSLRGKGRVLALRGAGCATAPQHAARGTQHAAAALRPGGPPRNPFYALARRSTSAPRSWRGGSGS